MQYYLHVSYLCHLPLWHVIKILLQVSVYQNFSNLNNKTIGGAKGNSLILAQQEPKLMTFALPFPSNTNSNHFK